MQPWKPTFKSDRFRHGSEAVPLRRHGRRAAPAPAGLYDVHLLGRDDLVRNAYLIEQPRCGNPVVRARPTSSRQRRNDARYTVVTDGMVRSPEQWCDLRRRAHQRQLDPAGGADDEGGGHGAPPVDSPALCARPVTVRGDRSSGSSVLSSRQDLLDVQCPTSLATLSVLTKQVGERPSTALGHYRAVVVGSWIHRNRVTFAVPWPKRWPTWRGTTDVRADQTGTTGASRRQVAGSAHKNFWRFRDR